MLSLLTKRSMQPSLLISGPPRPRLAAIDRRCRISWLTSVNVPSPLLWKSQLGHGLEKPGVAVIVCARRVRDRRRHCAELGEIDEAADEQVEAAVVVVIEPNGADAQPGAATPGFFGDVGEGAVAVIAVEDAAAVLRHVEIGEAVGVVVATAMPMP